MLRVKENPQDTPTRDSVTTPESSTPWYRRPWHFPRSWADVKRLGWRFILAFVIFYLIRDTILYIILPYLIYKGIISL